MTGGCPGRAEIRSSFCCLVKAATLIMAVIEEKRNMARENEKPRLRVSLMAAENYEEGIVESERLVLYCIYWCQIIIRSFVLRL